MPTKKFLETEVDDPSEMTLEEINAEIEIVRKERAARDGTRNIFHILKELAEELERTGREATFKDIKAAFAKSEKKIEPRKENSSC